jgi:hypothetical protein
MGARAPHYLEYSMNLDSKSLAARVAFLLLTGAATTAPMAAAMAQSADEDSAEVQVDERATEGSAEMVPAQRRRREQTTKSRAEESHKSIQR